MTIGRLRSRGVMVIATAAVAACGQDNRYAAPPPPKVIVSRPHVQKSTLYFNPTGNTAPFKSVTLVARVQGFLQAINYKDGDYGHEG